MPVVAAQIRLVRAHVREEHAHSLAQSLGRREGSGRAPLPLIEVQKRERRVAGEQSDGRFGPAHAFGLPLQDGERLARLRDTAEREAGVGRDEARRAAKPHVLRFEIGTCELECVLGATLEVGELGERDGARVGVGERLGVLAGMPECETAADERHKDRRARGKACSLGHGKAPFDDVAHDRLFPANLLVEIIHKTDHGVRLKTCGGYQHR